VTRSLDGGSHAPGSGSRRAPRNRHRRKHVWLCRHGRLLGSCRLRRLGDRGHEADCGWRERELRWDYIIRLNETAGRSIIFTTVRVRQIRTGAHPDAYFGASPKEDPFSATLAARSELRISMTQTLTVPRSAVIGSSVSGMRAGFAQRFESIGTDDTGKAVLVPVLVASDPG
jgi:hypothetical protein